MTRPTGRTRIATGFLALSVIGAGTAVAQQQPATTPTTSTPTTSTPTSTTPAATAPPVLRNLKLPATVTARQGHARFLVGVRLSQPAKLTVQVTAIKGNQLVRTITSADTEAAGRVYVMVEATNEQRFQLPKGRYRVRVQATDARARVSRPLERIITLDLTTPRGRLDMDLVPFWKPLARSLRLPASGGGQLVAALAPRGDSVRAGLRRNDVITAINGRPTLTTGQLAVALRGLPAATPVPVEFRRGAETKTVTLTVPADWNAAPDLTRTHDVIVRRNPKVLAPAVARALYQVEIGKPDVAQEMLGDLPSAWRTSAPGQFVQAKIWERKREVTKALGAYNRALKKDRTMAEAAFGRGLSYNSLGKDALAAQAFAQARTLDAGDASAAAFQAFSLIRADQRAQSLEPARAAAAIDQEYADAKIAEGIALINNGARARGVVALRLGLVLTDDGTRAQQIIDEYLEPNDR